MKRMKRRIVGILLSIIMSLQLCNIFAAEVTNSDVPTQLSGFEYKQIPVYFNGQQVTEFSTFLRKYYKGDGNPGSEFDISGTATFRVRAYAYGSKGSADVKLGTYIECLDKSGNWIFMDWWDQADQINKDKLKDFFANGAELNLTITEIAIADDAHYGASNNKNDLRPVFYMDASTAGKFSRPCNKNIIFATDGSINVTRTVTEIIDEKNVWEVALKVEGQIKVESPTTEVVLVLDRSGSMSAETSKKLVCTNTSKGHSHSNSCYKSITRADLVKDASQSLANSLVDKPNVNVAVVSFGGTQTKPSGSGYEHFNNSWGVIYETSANNGWYSNYILESGFTNSKDTLNNAISKAMGNINGGTPMSIGIIKAGLMLQKSEADNKIIILLSDGDPTYMRDGSGTGNRNTTSWNSKIDTDTINAANEAKNKVKDLKVYTIAAGSSISSDGKNVLGKCATNTSGYAYEAADTAEALKSVMDSIAADVNQQIASSTTLNDCLADNIQLQLPTTDMSKNVLQIGFKDEAKTITEDVDWSKVGIAVTQGSMKTLDNSQMVWDIGELKAGTPAIIKYRIYLKSGAFGESYNISKAASFNYLDSTGKTITNAIPNASIKLSWAKVNVKSYNFATKKKVENSEFTVWGKVPNDYKEGDITISSDTKFDTSTAEMDDSGNASIGDSVVVPKDEEGNPLELVAIILDGKLYETDAMTSIVSRMASRMTFSLTPSTGAVLTKSPTDFGYYYGEPDFTSVTDAENNFIQPEGVSNISAKIKFNTKSKDVSYTVDVNNLLNAQLDGINLMSYNMSKLSIQVKELNGLKRVLTKGVDYTFDRPSSNEIRVLFNNIIDEGTEYKIDMYMPSGLNSGVIYGGAGENTYLNKINTKTVELDTLIVAYPKIDEITLETGAKKEVYSEAGFSTDSTTDPTRKITLTYIEIAKIS